MLGVNRADGVDDLLRQGLPIGRAFRQAVSGGIRLIQDLSSLATMSCPLFRLRLST